MNYMNVILKEHSSNSVAKEVWVTITVLVSILDDLFQKYFNNELMAYLVDGIQSNKYDNEECQICIGVVGDIALAVRDQIIPYCDAIVEILLDNLRNIKTHRSLKSAILTCLSNIASAIGAEFDRYSNVTFQILEQACKSLIFITIDEATSYDLLNYMIDLGTSILDTYHSIMIVGMGQEMQWNVVDGPLNSVAELILYIVNNRHFLQNDMLDKAIMNCLINIFKKLDKEKFKNVASIKLIQDYILSTNTNTMDTVTEDMKKIFIKDK